MKKKTSIVAIIVAVMFSIILFPVILAGGVGASVVFTLESVLAPDREEELYQSFVKNGGIDWGYDFVIEALEESLNEGIQENLPEGMSSKGSVMGVEIREFLPKEQAEDIFCELYHAIIKGKEYQVDLSYQKNLLETKMNEYFDTTITEEIKAEIEETLEEEVRSEYGEMYDRLSESEKQKVLTMAREEAMKTVMEEAKMIFDKEVISGIDIEITKMEKQISEAFNSIYDSPEYQELKALEAEFGYSLTERTALCKDIRLAGNILLGITGAAVLVLLLCHWFRPSGFFTAGAFSLIIGGGLLAIAKAVPSVGLELLNSELPNILMEEGMGSEIPKFIMSMMEDILGWCLTGFEKVGKIGLVATIVFVLAGILLLVNRKNKKEAEV